MRSESRRARAAARAAAAQAAQTGRTSSRPARRRRDRRGRGLRGHIAPAELPLHRSPGEAFDDLVMDAVEELEQHWARELAGLEFAVEDVPPGAETAYDNEVVTDRGVALGRLFRSGIPHAAPPLHERPVVVVYRRPVEARAGEADDRADLVFMVVVDLVAEYLGRDVDELDPPP